MTVKAALEKDTATRIWGLTPRERLVRALSRMKGVVLSDESAIAEGDEVLLLRGDYVFDQRVLEGLVEAERVALRDPADHTLVAVRMKAPANALQLAGIDTGGLEEVTPDRIGLGLQSKLRKFDTPWVSRVAQGDRERIENALYDSAYKGVTDLITKWVWPLPARAVTRVCARRGIRPNHVTALSYLLTLLAGLAFWYGAYGPGLLAAWLMTFLDTVDGKLARVTLNSSRFGNLFDHILDIVHPPFWYLAWGVGLATQVPVAVYWVIFIAYIGGRLSEVAFKTAGPFSMFIWEPFDSVNRLVTARRNPCLLLLTLCWLLGAPYAGLLLVMLWTLISTVVLIIRVLQARRQVSRGAAVTPWLSRVEPRAERHRLVVRWFVTTND
ncbi:phosphatidylglycerophosphate synthase [Kushneria sinocarnis]|uniref:Phosphatidylglycerophosphate synthase n=1 Tax=Kushneria sinocarnis TaxID=595502 RepID=A0A420X008_9GAMM|nr:CDP-alcohol phosphatidyltransferase family protein [Kushneria sinocarnis]RKR06941.1 phosphatidylglycerophosphate synthase [Kushneria sinocarnis]